VVTGGLGTIAVSYKGKKYYVCCQGCVQAFNDDPETIIAEYNASLKKD
ncbi:MAG: YHS domain-containing protein, partial [Fuerstiella sp.]|nr:YHS domain-containing protein [Fuerstiella sp.]